VSVLIAVAAAATAALGPITDMKPAEAWNASYVCSYAPRDSSSEKPFFFSSTDDDSIDERYALVNIDGKDQVFELETSKQSRSKRNQRSTKQYKAGDWSLTVVTTEHSHEEEGSSITAHVTIKKGKQVQSKTTLHGYCAM